MDLDPYLSAIAADLERATALADESTRDIAHRLASALEPGLRLALVRAVSDTAAGINTELEDAVVTVTMAGHDPMVTVTRTTSGGETAATRPGGADDVGAPTSEDPGGTVRITLRLPEHLKSRAEDLAERAEQSLNTWLVQAVRRATADPRPTARTTHPVPAARRHTGWA
jgi:hypothetical protein